MQMRVDQATLPLLSALKYLSTMVERLESKIDDMQKQVEAMQEEWRHEYEVDDDSEWETESASEVSDDSEESNDSCQSAPASFSYKVQRTE